MATRPGLTLSEALRLALAHSPQLMSTQHEFQASEGALIQAGAWPNPELQAVVEDTRKQTRTTTVQLSQPLELGGQRAARISAASLSRDQAEVDVQARRAQVRADATEAFFASAIAQEHVRLAQAGAELATRAADAAARRVQAGKVSPVEATRANVAQAAVRLELIQAQGEWRVTRQRLSGLLGVPQAELGTPAWQAAEHAASALAPAAIEAQASRLSDAPALRQARLEVERRRALAHLAQTQRIPDVTLILGTKRVEELGRNQVVMGIALPLPVWDTNQGHVLQALRLLDKAQADLAAAQIQVDAQWQQLSERALSAQAQLQALQQEVLPGAESAWQAAVTGFELGKFSFLETLDAQRTLFQARAQYLKALSELHSAAADIDRLLGTEGTDAAPTPNETSKP